ncbi:MAG: hypothetical protein H7257_06470 [Taibaiella sp.]|nr:hypothetical protein [Taibaiella sp.]
MGSFLFQIDLPEFTAELAALIPTHRAYIDKLFKKGDMLSYSVALNRDKLWCVVAAEDEEQAVKMVLKLPLYAYFTDVVCIPLMFHNTSPAALPAIVLN